MESPIGKLGYVDMAHRNSEGEMVTIETLTKGGYEGQQLLCLYDVDMPVVAMTLLDDGLRAALLEELSK